MKKRAKVDDNQPDIVEAFRNFGFSVRHTHQLGGGFPDIVVGKHGKNYLIEIKDGSKPPSKQKLTADEEEFKNEWRGQYDVVASVDDVLNFAGACE